jgi:N-acetyl-alpha-D-glucosaminyl L-malate synthase BshA
MKIGIVCYPSLGGSGVIATELGHQLALRGHEIHFISYEEPFRMHPHDCHTYFHQVDINRYHLFKYPDYALALAVKMATVAKEHDLDILHVHYAIPHATSAFLAKQLLNGSKKPAVITTLHGTDITLIGRDPSYYDIVKFSIEQSDAVTAVSNDLRDETIHSFKIDKPVEVIYNFFKPIPKLMGTKPLRKSFVSADEKLLIHSSNFRFLKRTDDLIAIFREIKKKVNCKLLLLGAGEGIQHLHELVRQYRLTEDVMFLGKNRYVDAYMCSADLLLLPSERESFGLVALEAMAYGIPVIATAVGGLPEVVEDGKTGLLSRMGDVDKMANDAIELLTNDKKYQQFSQEGIKQAREKFSADLIVSDYIKCYERLV